MTNTHLWIHYLLSLFLWVLPWTNHSLLPGNLKVTYWPLPSRHTQRERETEGEDRFSKLNKGQFPLHGDAISSRVREKPLPDGMWRERFSQHKPPGRASEPSVISSTASYHLPSGKGKQKVEITIETQPLRDKRHQTTGSQLNSKCQTERGRKR